MFSTTSYSNNAIASREIPSAPGVVSGRRSAALLGILRPLAILLLLPVLLLGCDSLRDRDRKPFHGISRRLHHSPPGEALRVASRSRISNSLVRIRYANGLTLILDHQPEAGTVAVQSWAPVGSRQEPERHNGIAHLLEHLVFRGTTNFTAEEIRGRARRFGGLLNAETTWEYSLYYALVPAYAWQPAAQLIADLVLRPQIPEDTFETEKRVVLEEIARAHDDPRSYGALVVAQRAFPGHALGRPIFGTKESIERIEWEDVVRFHQRYYHAAGMVVVMSGRFDEEAVIRRIARLYADASSTAPRSFEGPKPAPTPNATPGSHTIRRLLLGAYVAIGAQTLNAHHPDAPAFEVLDAMLAGGRFAAIPKRLLDADAGGGASFVASLRLPLSDRGLWGVYAATTRRQAPAALDAMREVLQQVREQPIAAAEIERARAVALGRLARAMSSSQGRADFLGARAIFGAVRPFQAEQKRLRAVRSEDVQRVARQFLKDDQLLTFRLVSWRGPRRWLAALAYLF